MLIVNQGLLFSEQSETVAYFEDAQQEHGCGSHFYAARVEFTTDPDQVIVSRFRCAKCGQLGVKEVTFNALALIAERLGITSVSDTTPQVSAADIA